MSTPEEAQRRLPHERRNVGDRQLTVNIARPKEDVLAVTAVRAVTSARRRRRWRWRTSRSLLIIAVCNFGRGDVLKGRRPVPFYGAFFIGFNGASWIKSASFMEEHIQIEGRILTVLAGTMFRVELDNKHQVLATISGKMRKRFVRLTVGDRVKNECRSTT